MSRDKRFGRVDGEYVEQLEHAEWEGRPVKVGDWISFDYMIWSSGGGSPRRTEAQIIELWLERHPNVIRYTPEGLLFAECVAADGRYRRAWFHRDYVGDPGDPGKPPPDALF